MRIEIKVPQLSESISEATVLAWRKGSGEQVSRDESLVDIETDKVVLEVPAPQDGVIAEVLVKNGETVGSGQLLAILDTDAVATGAKKPPESKTVHLQDKAGMVMPSARKLMAEHDLTPEDVMGTGRGGRILKEDVKKKIQETPKSEQNEPVTLLVPEVGRPEKRVPMSRLRARIAERLVQSQTTAAILTTFNEVNMKPVMDIRGHYREQFEKEHGVKLGIMSFFVKAAVSALKKFPVLNASVDGNDIVYHGYYDIGIAVGSPRGLVVPVLRDADRLSMAEIERRIADFGQRAKEGKIDIEELTGGTFTISNGGVYGSLLSTPIINPPQSGILGVHATKDRPVVEEGQIVIRPMNYLALSYDHRIIDGREAVQALVTIKDALEDPARLILDI